MKIINSVVFIGNEINPLLKEKGLYNQHSQYTVYCRCRGIKHGNELCKDIFYNGFRYGYASACAAKAIENYFTEHPNVVYIITGGVRCMIDGKVIENNIITNIEVEKFKENK